MSAQVAVIKFPGSNCEAESVRALERVGLSSRIVRWNEPPEELARFAAYLLPGGFSYQDRVRAGAIAARLPLLEVLAERSEEGAPILGLCNGAQILVEAGLVPGDSHTIECALAPNRLPGRGGYYTRWIFLAPGPSAAGCLFTQNLDEARPMPMAHAEGRFTSLPQAVAPGLADRTCLRYAHEDGAPATEFPWNPNGSQGAAAGVTNPGGNVLALMPHPERAQLLAQVPADLSGPWGERRRHAHRAEELETEGPGLFIFQNLARALRPRGGLR